MKASFYPYYFILTSITLSPNGCVSCHLLESWQLPKLEGKQGLELEKNCLQHLHYIKTWIALTCFKLLLNNPQTNAAAVRCIVPQSSFSIPELLPFIRSNPPPHWQGIGHTLRKSDDSFMHCNLPKPATMSRRYGLQLPENKAAGGWALQVGIFKTQLFLEGHMLFLWRGAY